MSDKENKKTQELSIFDWEMPSDQELTRQIDRFSKIIANENRAEALDQERNISIMEDGSIIHPSSIEIFDLNTFKESTGTEIFVTADALGASSSLDLQASAEGLDALNDNEFEYRQPSNYRFTQPLPQKNKYSNVAYFINQPGIHILSRMDFKDFTQDAFNIVSDGVFINFNHSSIDPEQAFDGAHRDAIQIIGKGGLHYAGNMVSDIHLENVKIRSSSNNNKLQGITCFDGLAAGINLVNVDVNVDTDHAVTFNGLMYGYFNGIETHGKRIELMPLRLCGGNEHDGVPTIFAVEPFIIQHSYGYYYRMNQEFYSLPHTDMRRAFTRAIGRENEDADTNFLEKMNGHHFELYSEIRLDLVWQEARAYYQNVIMHMPRETNEDRKEAERLYLNNIWNSVKNHGVLINHLY